jgi:hypothetical protein
MSTPAQEQQVKISVAGKTRHVPTVEICGRMVVVTGKWLRTAVVRDEELVEGDVVLDPAAFIAQMKQSALRADILSFAQKIPESTPRHNYHIEWDNWAAIPITSYNDWWEQRLPQESRKNIRRAAKRGVVVKVVAFDDELLKGIQAIYNETPVRQGRPFWHFGKDWDTVKRENATYLDRSEFIGAYLNEELIGFIKIIYVDRVATLIQILSKTAHQDKRPTNALLAKAVEVCEGRGMSFLLYGKYVYGRNESSPLTEFKRRNGFEEIRFPRYFVPLTAKGYLAIKSGLHLGLRNVIPAPLVNLVRNLRAGFYRRRRPSGLDLGSAMDQPEGTA